MTGRILGRSIQYYVYILASAFRGTTYIGVTNNLIRRIAEHKEGIIPEFIKRYNVKLLVYYEIHTSIEEAIKREKLIKKWKRPIKYEAIEKENPFGMIFMFHCFRRWMPSYDGMTS